MKIRAYRNGAEPCLTPHEAGVGWRPELLEIEERGNRLADGSFSFVARPIHEPVDKTAPLVELLNPAEAEPLQLINVRCSRLDLLSLCGGASVSPNIAMDHCNALAPLGTAAHQYLRDAIDGAFDPKNQDASLAEIDALIDSFDVDGADLSNLCRWLWWSWEKVAELFPSPLTEQYMEWTDTERQIYLSGTADVLSLVGDELRVCDFKTGYSDEEHRHQIRGYALLAMMELPQVKTVYASILRPREGTYDAWRWTREEIMEWWAKTAAIIRRQSLLVNGRHCSYCPRVLECPGATEFYRQAMAVIGDGRPAVGGEISAETVRKVHDARKVLESMAQAAGEWELAIVSASGGEFDMGGGRRLELRDTQRVSLNARLALPLLQEVIGERAEQALKVDKGEAERIVKALAPRGQKGKAWSALMDRFSAAGATEVSIFQRLEVKRDPGSESATIGAETEAGDAGSA